MDAVSIGIDIGQKQDPTAIVVAEHLTHREWEERRVGKTVYEMKKFVTREEQRYVARYVGRVPLGTPYPKVTERIAEVVRNLQQVTTLKPTIYLDVTGVGRPVYEMVQAALAGLPHVLYACTFTHGDRLARVDGEYRVGKAHLVSRLQVLLQTLRIKLPETSEARQLAAELLDYEIKVDQDANDKYGAFKVGTHDDLVTALGLAVLIEPVKPTPPAESKSFVTFW